MQPYPDPQSAPLHDFELAQLDSVNPPNLRSSNGQEREIDALMLGLALIFNDLKDFLWFFGRLGPGARNYPQTSVHAERGQIGGMSLRIMRSIASTLHELLKLLEQKKHVIRFERFGAITELLKPDARRQWENLSELARAKGGPEKDSIGALLKNIRDKTGGHYDVNVL